MRIYLMAICLTAAASLSFAQDEFFQPGYSIGGYGELHLNRVYDAQNNDILNRLDFHRFIMYYAYQWTESWSFKSELELEHNFIEGGEETGELELEQAFINYHHDQWGFQGGIILPSVGILNEYHEPPLFFSVERPLYSKEIIPTTWFGNGFSVYYSRNGIDLRIALLEDLDGENIGYGIRSSRSKGYKSTAYSWTKNFSLDVIRFPGLKFGGSATFNSAPVNDDDSNSVQVSLYECHAQYQLENFYSVFEYGYIHYNNNPLQISSSSGYYLDLGYDIASFVRISGELLPWVRLSNVAKADSIPSEQQDIIRMGFIWRPIPTIAFKLDYGKLTSKNEPGNPFSEFNAGVGYYF